MGLAVLQYVQDHDGAYPFGHNEVANPTARRNWYFTIDPYLKSRQIFVCPSDSDTAPAGNTQLTRRQAVSTCLMRLTSV